MRDKKIIYFFCILIAIGLLFQFMRSFHVDELEGIHTAWKITQGEVIYRDFFQHHHPFSYYLIVPIIMLFGETITTLFMCRMVFLSIELITCYYIYLLALLIYHEKSTALASIILLLGFRVFMSCGFQIRPDTPMMLFEVLSVYNLLLFFNTNQKKNLLISAISLSLSLLFLQKALIFCSYIFCLLLYRTYRKQTPVANLLFFSVTFFLTLAPFFFYYFYNNQLNLYFTLNWLLNAHVIPPPESRFLESHLLLLLASFVPVSFFLHGLWAIKSVSYKNYLRFLAIGLLLVTPLYPLAFPWYIIPSLPYIAMIGAYALRKTTDSQPNLSCILLTLLTVIMVSSNISLHSNKPLAKQLKDLDYALSVTTKQDYVLEGQFIRASIFRKDADYFWFNVAPHYGTLNGYQYLTGYHYDPYDLLEKYKPKLINIDAFENLEDHRLLDHYVPTEIVNVWIRIN